MITRQELRQLQSLNKIPALSILLPTHRMAPENRQDPIQVKNLVDEATRRLSEEFSDRDLQPLMEQLETLVSKIDYNYTLDGLALYISDDFAQLYYLPFTVPARVVIDQTFATRDLVYGMHRSMSYWVLLLSQASTRLLAGTAETLEEVQDQNFPMQMTGPAATGPIPFDADSSYIDDRYRRFFQKVDSAFSTYTEDKMPLLLGGVVRQISFFQEVSQHAGSVVGTISGNFDRSSVSELAPQFWELMQPVREALRAEALQELDQAMGAQKVVSTIEEVWRLAQDGRGRLLLVEKNYHVPAILSAGGGIERVSHPGGTEIMDDAVDEIIEAVLAKGGEVAIVDDGSLSEHQQIALILRY